MKMFTDPCYYGPDAENDRLLQRLHDIESELARYKRAHEWLETVWPRISSKNNYDLAWHVMLAVEPGKVLSYREYTLLRSIESAMAANPPATPAKGT